jgi:hypothetical protein
LLKNPNIASKYLASQQNDETSDETSNGKGLLSTWNMQEIKGKTKIIVKEMNKFKTDALTEKKGSGGGRFGEDWKLYPSIYWSAKT